MKAFILSTSLLWALCPSLAAAQSTTGKDDSLTAWYIALQKADVPAMEALMAPDDVTPFKYTISDLGIEQNRKEFIESMAEWVGAIDGGSIEYKITTSSKHTYTALVCYRFVGSEFLAEENIGILDTKITSIAQTSKGDSCADF